MSAELVEAEQIRSAVFQYVQIKSAAAVDGVTIALNPRPEQLQAYWSYTADQLLVQLSAYLLGVEGEIIEQYVEAPADWWQAVRERWAPGWWLKRYPVKTRVLVDIHAQRYEKVCPHATVHPEGPEHIQWLAEGQ